MSIQPTMVTAELAAYIREMFLSEPPALTRLQQENTTGVDWELQVSTEQGKLLHFLARLIGAKRIIEVGVFTGYSSTWMALALPIDGKLVACDCSEGYARRAGLVL